jgi:hypothetical protein
MKKEDWKSPLNRVLWMQALRKKQKQVTLRDGRVFDIDYNVRPLVYKTTGEVRQLVYVKLADGGQAPCGFFDLKECTNAQWVSDAHNKVKVMEPKPNVKSK